MYSFFLFLKYPFTYGNAYQNSIVNVFLSFMIWANEFTDTHLRFQFATQYSRLFKSIPSNTYLQIVYLFIKLCRQLLSTTTTLYAKKSSNISWLTVEAYVWICFYFFLRTTLVFQHVLMCTKKMSEVFSVWTKCWFVRAIQHFESMPNTTSFMWFNFRFTVPYHCVLQTDFMILLCIVFSTSF